MRYKVRVAGKIFESEDTRVLIKRAVEAKRESLKTAFQTRELVRPMSRIKASVLRSI